MEQKVKNMPRDQQKAVFWNMAHPKPITKQRMLNKMKQRSKRAKAIDRSKTAKHTYDARDKEGKKKWMKHPNRYDIKGIDNSIAKDQYKARISKRQLKEKKQQKRKITRKLEKKKVRIKQVKKPEEKKKLEKEIKEKEQKKEKIELDIKDVEVGHKKTRKTLHEKQEEKKEVMYVMKTTDNNSYVESKALLERAKNKGLDYDQVDWDQLQGSDLVYEERVNKLEQQVGETYTDEEMGDWRLEEEKYQHQYADWIAQQK